MVPSTKVVGANKLPSEGMQLLGKLLGYGMVYAGILVAFASFVLPANHPIGQMILEHKMHVFLGGYMLMMVGGQVLSTGAFEVYVNGKLYFDKGSAGGFPDLDALARSTAQYIATLQN